MADLESEAILKIGSIGNYAIRNLHTTYNNRWSRSGTGAGQTIGGHGRDYVERGNASGRHPQVLCARCDRLIVNAVGDESDAALSAGYHRVLKLARTIADLAGGVNEKSRLVCDIPTSFNPERYFNKYLYPRKIP